MIVTLKRYNLRADSHQRNLRLIRLVSKAALFLARFRSPTHLLLPGGCPQLALLL